MATEPKEPQTTEPEPTDDAEKREAAFWEKMEATLDGWLDKKVKTRPTGTSRNPGSRRGPADMVADLFFGDYRKS